MKNLREAQRLWAIETPPAWTPRFYGTYAFSHAHSSALSTAALFRTRAAARAELKARRAASEWARKHYWRGAKAVPVNVIVEPAR